MKEKIKNYTILTNEEWEKFKSMKKDEILFTERGEEVIKVSELDYSNFKVNPFQK
jgi:hypothetical protein